MKLRLIAAIIFTICISALIFIPENSNLEWGAFIGNFHPLFLHLPIGALLALFVVEVFQVINPKLSLENLAQPLLWFSVITVIPTVVAGFLLASTGGYNKTILNYHKWLGFVTAVLCVWLLVLHYWLYTYKPKFINVYKFLLAINVVVLSVAGHFGGSLTHGDGYLTKDMPNNLKAVLGIKETQKESLYTKVVEEKKDSVPANIKEFVEKIQPILDQRCYECHNANKQKGDLRLDNLNWDITTPHGAKVWDDILYEVTEQNMPPEEKEPLTEVQRNLIIKWIQNSFKQEKTEQPTVVENKEKIKKEKKVKVLAKNTSTKRLSKEEAHYRKNIQPIFQKYCYQCHNQKRQKGNMRLDNLNWDMIKGHDAEKWNSALDEINKGEMPPKKKKQPNQFERKLIVDWMTSSLAKASDAKQVANNGVMRRLTKKQYTYTLNELLGLPINFGYVLPDDGKSKMGFSNNGEVLQISPLHIDYYQKIAREALNKAIVLGDKPKSTKYKVTFGKGIGAGKPGAEFGGFQSVAMNKKDFLVEVAVGDEGYKNTNNYDTIKNKIGFDFRGSDPDRHSVVKEGLLMHSAKPHKELPPKSWQGPSPNVKMVVKNYFRGEGSFVFRMEASKGYIDEHSEMIFPLKNQKPRAKTEESIVIQAKDIDLKKGRNLILNQDKTLIQAKDITKWVNAKFKYNVKKEGYYQIDVVHPYVNKDEKRSISLGLLGTGGQKISYLFKEGVMQENKETTVTPIGLIYLKKGKHLGLVQRSFFVGMYNVILTPIKEGDPILRGIRGKVKLNMEKYKNDFPSIRTFAGARTDDGQDYLNYDVSKKVTTPFGGSQKLEFKGYFEDLPVPVYNPNDTGEFSNMMHIGFWNDYLVKDTQETGPVLLVKNIELEMPYHPVWPPKSHTAIFFDSPNKDNKESYTKEVLTKFMERAFRRSVDEKEVNRYMSFWQSIKKDHARYETGVKETLVAVLCSPNFLYILDQNNPNIDQKKSDYYLASKLSYFLWNSPPDQALVAAVASGKFRKELPKLIASMVNDKKVMRMIRSFASEWLRIDRHKGMNTSVQQYADYTRFVKEDMSNETYQFLNYILKENKSILNFIDSDFAMLNQNLAEFYGVKGVKGNEFRPVAVAQDLNRGGLLSQGAFLNGHSDGEQAHPIKRAVWLKEKILGDPAPPPPPNVPEIDPDTPGFDKLTLKEQLELHRNKPSCISCHQKIDPYGVVFENFDAVGRFQSKAKGKLIDSKSILPDGTEVEGIRGIKKYIIAQKSEDFTRSVVKHLFAYALGRNVTFADDKEIDNIVKKVREDDYKFQTIIKEIVLSPSFSKKM
ncbi:DUF1592 domain-containing protein [Wenyingzhuangia aestuarii]|uniref:DUF1592 domain-containing protein n=1 Tax=Wenyingzhuangia aestuarii TaxID=1647582 RepID=UPI001439ECF2|nr:DUF1592 domain-containing protein [Wenyingzhuangia aestuarii]NJB83541.1 putative membrane protein [Wenyingzhuangia aestuarii]